MSANASNYKKDLPKYVAIPVESLKNSGEHGNLRVIENLFIKQLADGSICLVHPNEDKQDEEQISTEKTSAPPIQNNRVKSRSILLKHSLKKQASMLPDQSKATAKRIERKFRCIKCENTFDSLLQFRDHMKWHKYQKKFKCPKCLSGFNAENNLKIHMVLDHSEESHSRCPICDLSLSSQRTASLKSHVMLHQVEEIYTCDECGAEFDKEDDFIKHIETHAAIKKCEVRPLTCSYCKVEFKDSKELRAHVSGHAKLKKNFFKPKRPRKSGSNREHTNHVCTVCNKSFIKNSLLERHKRIHSGERPFKCEICNRGFTQKGSLQIHLNGHTGDRPFSCTLCPARFNQKGNLRVHIQKTHTFPNGGHKMYKCSQCTCIFKKIATLNGHVTKAHLNSNQGDDNVIDDVMSKLKELEKQTSNSKDQTTDRNKENQPRERIVVTDNAKEASSGDKGNTVQLSESTTDGALRKYVVKQRKIGDVRWYFCNNCTKQFKKPSDLIRHIRVHTKEKPFKCKQCTARFSLKSTLVTHIKTHENRLEWTCKICDTSFASLRILNAHLRKHEFDSLPKWQCVTCGYLFDEYEKGCQHRVAKGRDKPHIIQPFINHILKQPLIQTTYGSLASKPPNTKFANTGLESPTLRPFHCTICDARFTKRINLKRHIQFHKGERNFKCIICPKTFITSYHLTEHMNYHNNIRKYPCKICKKRFVTASLLKRHLISHNTHKTYQCPYCFKTFKTILLCRSHIRQVHKKEVVPKIEVEEADSLTNDSSIGNNLNAGDGISGPVPKVEVEEADSLTNDSSVGNGISEPNQVITTLSDGQNGVTGLSTGSQSLIIQQFLPTSNSIQILSSPNGDVQDQSNYQTIYVNIDELQFLENSSLDLSNATLLPQNPDSLLINQMSNLQDNVIFNIDSLNPDLSLPPVEILPNPQSANTQIPPGTALPSIAEISTKTIKLSSYSDKSKTANLSPLLDGNPNLFTNMSYAEELSLPTTISEGCNVFDPNFQPTASADLNHADIFESTNVMCLTCSRVFVTVEQFQEHSCALLTEGSRNLEVLSNEDDNSESEGKVKDPLQCHLCNETLANEFSLDRHLKSHAARPNFECSVCKKVMNGRNAYIKHLATHKTSCGKLLRTCKFCLRCFKKPSDLNRHVRTHTGEKPYACHLCDKKFSLKSTLDSHLKTHDRTPKQFTCNICNSSFTSKASLKVHVTIHTGQRPHRCTFCEQKFRTPGNRKSHELLMHLSNPNKKPRNKSGKMKITSVLESMASVLDGGEADKEAENNGNKTSANQIEADSPAQVVNLIPPSDALLSNLGEDQIAIDPVILLQQLQMSGVILTHDAEPAANLLLDDVPLLNIDDTKDTAQGVSILSTQSNGGTGSRKTVKARNIECDICHKMYSSKDVVRKHKKKVHGKHKKFPCIKCDKGFDTQDELSKHVKLHAGYRPFSCLYCANSFTEEQSLKTHVKRIHQHSNATKDTSSALLNMKFDLQSENIDDPLLNNIFMLKKID